MSFLASEWVKSTGGTTSIVGSNVIHTFTTTGPGALTINLPITITANVLIVGGGGGGGGGYYGTGGGGAGMAILLTGTTFKGPGAWTLRVGTGGTGGTWTGVSGSTISATNGGDTTFLNYTAYGGGLGGANALGSTPAYILAGYGGCGGGGGASSASASSVAEGQPLTSGYAGGVGNRTTVNTGGGGGGAGGAGTAAGAAAAGNGGIGFTTDISGTSTVYGGGGGGTGGTSSLWYTGTGGTGGGGAGATSRTTNGFSATYYGGGGGGSGGDVQTFAGNGYQGIIIISYAYTQPQINNYFKSGPTVNKISFSLKDVSRLFYTLSAGARMNMTGVFALKKLTEYNGPVIDVQRQSDNANASVYADTSGNLTVAGSSLSSWLGASTGNVTKWYDQSRFGRHAIQPDRTLQPQIDVANGRVDFLDSSRNVGLYTSIPGAFSNCTSFTVTTKHSKATSYNITGDHGIWGAGGYLVNYYNNSLIIPSSSTTYKSYFLGADFNFGTVATGDRVTVKFTASTDPGSSPTSGTRYAYINGSLSSSVATSPWYGNGDTTEYIGRNAFTNSFGGQLYYICMFSTSLTDGDRAIVESI
jgi:hypothetical protein